MKVWFHKNYKTLIISAFLIPIMTVAVVSISHVTQWYGISNPFTWAIYLSIGVEIAALSALAAISANMGKKIYLPFGIVTLIQFIGNIFFAYSFIDVTASSFKSWVELVSPLLEMTGVEPTDFIGHKRFLAFFSGGMLPLISLSFLHMLVKFSEEDKQVEFVVDNKKEEVEKIDASDLIGEISRVRLSEEDLEILEKHLLNPQKPNETLVRGVEEYEKIQRASLKDKESLSDEEIMERAREIELKNIHKRVEKIKKIQDEIRGYEDETEDPVGALANSEYRNEEILTDEEFEEFQNAIDEELTSPIPFGENIMKDDIQFSDKFLDEAISEFNKNSIEEMIDESWDVGVEPIDVDKTDEPIYQTDSKEMDKMMNIVNEAIDEKKK